jgi:RecG-like helicase
MIPVYPASAKASSWMIARAVKTVLDPLDAGEDPLPAELRERHGLAAGPRRSAPSTGRSTRPT